MKRRSLAFILVSSAICASVAWAGDDFHIQTLNTRNVVAPLPSDCAASGTCSLKRVRLQEIQETISLGDMTMYATDLRIGYDTVALGDIESYSVVQWIKGCQFESSWDGTNVQKTLTVVTPYFGKQIPFQMTDWMIDTDSTDPVYSSFQGTSRYSLLKWNADPKSLNPDTATYYSQAKPPHPDVFVTDMPSPAELETSADDPHPMAKNSSLEFRTCIFHSADVPDTTDPLGSNVALDKAIACFAWDHKFVYNFQTKKFESPKDIDPVCAARL